MKKDIRILVVEDSEDDMMLLIRELNRGGFKPHCKRVETRKTMSDALINEPWDLVLTDHNMPGFNSTAAIDVMRELELDTPIIIVSGSIGEEIAVAAMKTGAHDYIMKDNMARLVPAIERELREVDIRRAHRNAEETIRHMAYHDSLTGLTNRHDFEIRLSRAIFSAREQQTEHALLYLDLDQFKIVNDTCGHVAGDELLKQLSIVFHKPVRERDTLARIGGDEFGVLMENCHLEKAKEIAEKLLQSVREFRFSWQKKTFTLGVSIGLVIISDDGKTMSEILSAADMACYAAKDKGRNRIQIYRDNDSEVLHRRGEMQWLNLTSQALRDNRFVLHRQYIHSLRNDNAGEKYCEFLVRMLDENGELIMPGAFIPAAERYDLMSDLDRWVINDAFKYLAKQCTKKNSSTNPVLSFINLSGASLSDEKFFSYISEKLIEYKIPRGSICFEITETATIANLKSAVKFINEIKEAGCLFALDDFGSGMSSFSYLKTIPADFLKIDGEFVRDMLLDPMDTAIVEAINKIGHVAGLRTIAEFVESPAIMDRLRTIGVDYAQGYGIDEPAPIVLN